MVQPIVVGSLLVYTAIMFAVAYWADSRGKASRLSNNSPIVYGLSFAVYCTSWTYYGAVGTAEARGWEFLPIYLGPALTFALAFPVIRKMVDVGREIHSTSIADFLSAHYGQSRTVSALVTGIAVFGTAPYIALQLKSVTTTFAYFSPDVRGQENAAAIIAVAVVLAIFAIIFGLRNVDVTRHNRGMIAAIAFDSVIKLLGLTAVAGFALYLFLSGQGAADLGNAVTNGSMAIDFSLSKEFSVDRFITLTVISAIAILALPRQFHVAVVEAESSNALRSASGVFLLYLFIVSVCVLPIAIVGQSLPALANTPADLHVIALPLSQGSVFLASLAFVGGFAAATGMVIVASVALSTMIANEIVAPLAFGQSATTNRSVDIGNRLLRVRRLAVCSVLAIAALFAINAPAGEQLASLGILSFAAVAQFAPLLLGALYWPGRRAEGAIAGLMAGFTAWVIFLFLPLYANIPSPLAAAQLPFVRALDPLTIGVIVSLCSNLFFFWLFSTVSQASARGSLAADDGLAGVAPRELYRLVQQCLGEQDGRLAITEFERYRSTPVLLDGQADTDLIDFVRSQLSKVLGASSARILLKSALNGGSLKLDDVGTLISETNTQVQFSRELLETAMDNTSHGVSVVDKNLCLVAWNNAYLEMFDYPESLIEVGRPIEDLIRYNATRGLCGDGEIDELVKRRLSALKLSTRHAFERHRPDGRVIRIEGVPSPSGAYVTSFSDITGYKDIEKALRDSQRSIEFYTDNIPALVAFADSNETLKFANDAYRKAFNLNESDVGTTHMADYLDDETYQERQPYIRRALAGDRTTFDIEVSQGDAAQFMQVTYVPQSDATGNVRGFFGLYQDITARRRAELALEETNESLEERVAARTQELSHLNIALEKAREAAESATLSKTRFLAAASHDVLQPLNAARLFASALSEENDIDKVHALAEKLNSSISSADQLLRSLLNISKLDAGGITPEFSEFPLSEVFQSLEATAAATASHKGLRMSFAPTSVSVRSDKGLLTSALQNLVANAIRYTERGGVVVGARRQGDKIRIDVIDTGPGIPDAKRDEIFVEFKRLDTSTGTRGAGLGLATVDRITRLLSTRVELDTEPGVGSRFSISVPRAEAQRSTAGSTFSEIKLSKQTSPLISQSVLCIDNDERALDGMKNLFERWGMSVHGFTSDDAALQSFTDNRPPDILLLDYQLDDDRTGFDALRALETFWQSRPLTIMITASFTNAVREEAAQKGIPVVSKPVEPAEIRALMSHLQKAAAE